MKRFHSRVESLHRVREQTEKLARLSAAVSQAQKHEADQQVQQTEREIQELSQMAAQNFGVGCSSTLMQSVMAAMAHSQQQLGENRQQQEQAELELTAAIERVVGAQKDVQVVDWFQEREFRQHRQRQMVDEEHVRTESSSRRHARRTKPHGNATTEAESHTTGEQR